MAFSVSTQNTEFNFASGGSFLRIGSWSVWITRSDYWDWKPKVERDGTGTFFWFLNVHAVMDTAQEKRGGELQLDL